MRKYESDTIEITDKRLKELKHAENKLSALESAGVDNWEGYSDAMDMLSEMEGE